MRPRVLIVEDEAAVVTLLRYNLEREGFDVSAAYDGEEALLSVEESPPDIILLDWMLPGMDGLSIIRALRAADDRTPVLVLSALGEVDDRVQGLRAGGDDYLVKPFAFSELLARLEALVRRGDAKATETILRVGDLELDRLAHTVRRGSQPVELQPREFRLLEYLMRHTGQVVTRTMLSEGVWDYHFDPQTNVIDVHISRLRSKIDKGFNPPLLHTVRGAGYCLKHPDDSP